MGHPEIAAYYFEILDTIETPDTIYEGSNEAKIAIKNFQKEFRKFIVVVYKETSINDGFVITAFFTKKLNEFKNKRVLWKR